MTNMSLYFFFRIRQFALMGKSHLKDYELLKATVKGLKAIRIQHNLTQEDFYNDTGIHISRIETGKVNISLSTLKTILDYYKVSLGSFFQNLEL